MTNKDLRELKETQNVFSDPKYCREAWRSVGGAILRNPCNKPIPTFDKEGNKTYSSLLEEYSYSRLKDDLKQLNEENREPTEIEMIMMCQIVKARTDTSAAIFVRDTLGAKPVDESKVDQTTTNVYESLSDEEIDMLMEHRNKKKIEEEQKKKRTDEDGWDED